jgi:hypothetical protein
MSELNWDAKAKDIYERVTNQLPEFHRTIAKRLAKESAEELAKARGSQTVEEGDLISAFFKEVPPAFKTMMTRLLERLNIDYKKYADAGDHNTKNQN